MVNEPRAYRESIAEVLRELRPEVDVVTADPAEMDASIARLRPDMVVCSSVTEAARMAPVWVELYPGHGPASTVGVAGEGATTVEDMQLSDLLAVVDRAERMAQR
jgi:hypothetical protein